jgi:uncharacterized protein (DUF302 family)
MTHVKKTALILLAGVAVLAAGAGLALPRDDRPAADDGKGGADYTRSTDRPYDQVHDAVTRAAKAQGFRVSGEHKISESLKKDGIDIPPYAAIEVCNSRLAAQVLKAEPRLGTLMPCRIAVYRQGDRTVVSMVLPSRLMTLFPEKPAVKEAAAAVDRAMKAIVDEATGAGGK